MASKRKRTNEEDEEASGSEDSEGLSEEADLGEAALHTLWNVDDAKSILEMIAEEPNLTVFAAIRSQWGTGLEVQKAVDEHIAGMYDSGYAEPCRGGGGICDMLRGTRELAEKLLPAKEFHAAFFFAHAAAEMIRRCEEDEEQGNASEWAEALDTIMVGAVKGWREQDGDGKKAKQDAATLVKLLVNGAKIDGCDQKKWYPKTLKALKAWAK